MVQPPETAPLIQAAGCKLESRQLVFPVFSKIIKKKEGARKSRFRWFQLPIPSVYYISTYSYHTNQPNVSK